MEVDATAPTTSADISITDAPSAAEPATTDQPTATADSTTPIGTPAKATPASASRAAATKGKTSSRSKKSTTKDPPTKAGGDALPSLPQPLKLPTFEEALVPKTTVRNLARPVLPSDGSGSITKDALTALTKGTSVFVSYLSHLANGHCLARRRKTVLPIDVFDAIHDAGLGQFVDELKAAHDEAEIAKTRKREAAKLKTVSAAADDDEDGEEDGDGDGDQDGDVTTDVNPGPSRKKQRISRTPADAAFDADATEDEGVGNSDTDESGDDDDDDGATSDEDDNAAALPADDDDDGGSDADRPGPTSRRDEALDDDDEDSD